MEKGKLYLRQSKIQFFFWGKGGPRIPRQTRAYGARERLPVGLNPLFQVPPLSNIGSATGNAMDVQQIWNQVVPN